MKRHFDERQVEAAAERIRQRNTVHLSAAGSAGAQARMNYAVLKPFVLALTREVNRGSGDEDILAGVASVMANIAASSVMSCTLKDTPPEIRAATFNRLTIMFGDFACQKLFDGKDVEDEGGEAVQPMQGGTA